MSANEIVRPCLCLIDASGGVVLAVLSAKLQSLGLQLSAGMVLTVYGSFVLQLIGPRTTANKFFTIVMVVNEAALFATDTSGYQKPSGKSRDLFGGEDSRRQRRRMAWLGMVKICLQST
jgi:hypothetical protein